MRRRNFLTLLSASSIWGGVVGCGFGGGVWISDEDVWKGESLEGWMTLEGQPVKVGWQAKGGEISLKRSFLRAGHIVTRKEYGDFELSFEWKIAKGGNSGLKYRVKE